MNYSYTARNKTGEKMSGTIEATDKSDAMRKLERMGLIPVSLNAGGPPPSGATISIKLPPPKKIALPAGILVLLLVILYLASPYWSLYRMRHAVQNNDAVYVSDHVDFPKLRESLKATFKTQMAKEVAKEDADGYEAFGAALGAMMIGPMVDALVTPEGLIGMMQGKDLDELDEPSPTANSQPQQRETTESEEMNVSSMRYEKLNRFIVEIADTPGDSSDEESLTMVFHRAGLFSWKLTGIRLQLN